MKRHFFSLLLSSILIALAGCEAQPSLGNPDQPVTWTQDIAPIIHQNCTPCHRQDGGAPFNLVSYNDVYKRAEMVAMVTRDRYMPPWPADPNYSHFLGERYLTDAQIALIQLWVDSDALLGDSLNLPVPPEFPTGSNLGKPDLILTFPEPIRLPGNNTDQFFIAKLPYEIDRDTFVRVFEFVPGNRQLAHHVNGHLVSYSPAQKADVQDGQFYVNRDAHEVEEAMALLKMQHDDGSWPPLTPVVCNYLPGLQAAVYPEGIGGYRISRKGALLFNDIHYGPTPKDTFDISHVNVFFAKSPPKRPITELQMGTLGISDIVPPLVVPPDTIMTFRTRALVKDDISLLTINPHMHLLGKDFRAYAITPKLDTIPLIWIPNWDFRWQYYYTYPKMLHIPGGSTIEVVATFDNTVDNPNQPFDPPQTVSDHKGSMKTTEEMLQFIFTFIPYQPGDENISLENPAFGGR